MGRLRRTRTPVKNKQHKKGLLTKNRPKDLDQIQDEMKTLDPNNMPIDPDLPGLGQFYCITCARHFINAVTLAVHNKTKPHKRKIKLALEKPYSQAEADAAAGMGPAKKD